MDATLCAHAGSSRAIHQASVYDFESIADFQGAEYYYRRYGSPNVKELGEAMARLEDAQAGLATSSGMGAILASLLSVCKCGDTVVAGREVYGGTYELLVQDMERFGIQVRLEDLHDVALLNSTLAELAMSKAPDSTVAVFLESISNPLIKVADVPAVAKACKQHGFLLIVDNTFATPLRSKPLKEGADMVVHSATKFLGGHHDALAGALVGSLELVEKAAALVRRWGLCASPFDAWLVMRGIQTLEVRMQRSWHSAALLAQRLEKLSIKTSWAPQCAMVAFEVPGGFEGVEAALEAFSLIKLSPSLGGTCTTVSHSASSSHKALSQEQRNSLGITDGLLRMSVGLETSEDIWNDLEQALSTLSKAHAS